MAFLSKAIFKIKGNNAAINAAFLMATAAIGPGFITQTTVYTGTLFTSFAFVIIISIVFDIVIQLNIWRIIVAKGIRAPQIANQVLPGAGQVLVFLIAVGGLVFNMGNIAGCGLAVQSLSGLPVTIGATVSAGIAIVLFLVKEFGKAMDAFAKVMGFIMIGLMMYVAFSSAPPWTAMAKGIMLPDKIDGTAIITLVGGTVGGYISFAGAHRLLDNGIKGQEKLKVVDNGAVVGILLAGIMRILLFAAVAGVVATGFVLPKENPAAAIFKQAAGQQGLFIFGIILWSAASTSVVAAAYTSVSFISSINKWVEERQRWLIASFIIGSLLLFIIIGQPTAILIWAGTINGMILPLALALMLIAANKANQNNFRHNFWLLTIGWVAVVMLSIMSVKAVLHLFK